MDAKPLEVEETLVDGHALLSVAGELDIIAAPVLQDAVDRVLGEGHRSLVLDLTGVRFLDSAGLRVLVAAHHALNDERGQMRIVCATARVRDVFRVANLDELFVVCDSFDDAIKAE